MWLTLRNSQSRIGTSSATLSTSYRSYSSSSSPSHPPSLHKSSHRLTTSAPTSSSSKSPYLSTSRPLSRTLSLTMSAQPLPSFSTVNFYAGGKLNRLSWLRTSNEFMNSALTSPDAKFVLLKNLNPLCHKGGERDGLLATLSWDQVKPTITESVKLSGGDPSKGLVYGPDAFGLSLPQGHVDAGESKDFEKSTEAIGPHSIALVFLGVDESQVEGKSLPGELVRSLQVGEGESKHPAGIPYFALSLTYRSPGTQGQTPTERLREELESSGEYDFVDTRALARSEGWERYEAALVAQARSMIDWNERNQFCPACSRRQYSLWGGYKRGCSSALGVAAEGSEFAKPFLPPPHRSFKEDGKGFCPSTKVLSNFCYSRLDPVVIMCIISPDGEKILLGRQKSWPKGMMSCLAGFCEAGESLEESVRREVFEEAGVGVGAVIYHSTQPWPFPNSLMCGMMGVAIEGQDKIRLDLDNELEEARFFTRQEVLEALSSSTSNFSKDDLAKIDEKVRKEMEEERKAKGISEEEWTKTVEEREKTEIRRTSLRLPPPSAIAHTLVASWARKEAVIPLPPKGKM